MPRLSTEGAEAYLVLSSEISCPITTGRVK